MITINMEITAWLYCEYQSNYYPLNMQRSFKQLRQTVNIKLGRAQDEQFI